MSLTKLFTLILLVGSLGLNAAKNRSGLTLPENSIVIKAESAADVNVYFSKNQVVSFSIYKSSDLEATLQKLQASDGVKNVNKGRVTGDYTMITVTLNGLKDKAYWSALFVTAGFKQIKINNSDPVDVDKL
jgi:hypothetical protein